MKVTEQLEGNDTLVGLLKEHYGVMTWWELGELVTNPIKKSASTSALHRLISRQTLALRKTMSERVLYSISGLKTSVSQRLLFRSPSYIPSPPLDTVPERRPSKATSGVARKRGSRVRSKIRLDQLN